MTEDSSGRSVQLPVDTVSTVLESHWERDLVVEEQETELLRALPAYAAADRVREDVVP